MSDALGKIEREEGRHEPGSSKPAHDHSVHGGHGHVDHAHAHTQPAPPSARARRSRSLFLASAFDRLLLVIVVIGVLWLGVAWAIL